ncbi:MAG TPA: MFS transporter [Solirubrobacterales bacterium]|nr:MFS transporter [Solirubrobacterales bacterium]
MAYRRILARPHVLALCATSVLARLPVGMGAVALVIFVHDRSGSFGAAGLVAGAFTVGLGATSPLLGRLVDRRGPRPVLIPCALLAAAALVGVVALAEAGAGTAPLVLAAAVAGCATPPVGGLLRQLWPRLVEPGDLVNGYVIDSLLIEIFFVAGPLLTGLLAATVGPASPLLVAAGAGLAGAIWFAAIPVLGGVEPAAAEHRTRAGALASPAIRLLIVTGIPIGITFGVLDVVLPAFGAEHGNSALGGPFVAATATGSAIGALVYGSQAHRFRTPAQGSVAMAIYQPLVVLPLLLADSNLAMFLLAPLTGSYIAPATNLRNQIAQAAMPPGTGTEAFTWLALSLTVGASAGAALAGPLVQANGWQAGVLLAAGLPALCIPVILLRRELLHRAVVKEEAEPASGC